jgi:uncharacterized membrane protein YcaP (DUF421 family)
MLFSEWSDLGRLLLAGLLVYAFLIAVLRISGNRTLAKLNAFDLVVTVALGSTLASVLINRSVSVTEGALALFLLIALQYLVAATTVRVSAVGTLVKAKPALLVDDGNVLQAELTRQRVTVGEVRQALRKQGIGGFADVAAVVLETDGSLSVIARNATGSGDAIADVPRP